MLISFCDVCMRSTYRHTSGKLSCGQRFLFHHFSDNRTKSGRTGGQIRDCKFLQPMMMDRTVSLWWRFEPTVAKNWTSRWLLQIDVVTRKIILRKRMTLLMIVYGPELFLNDLSMNGPFWASFVVSPFRRLSFRRFVVLRSRQKNKVNFKFLIWNAPAMIATIAMYGNSDDPIWVRDWVPIRESVTWMMIKGWRSRDDEKAFCVNSSANKNARFVNVVRKIHGQFFFEFQKKRSPSYRFVMCDDGGLSKAHIARHNRPIP